MGLALKTPAGSVNITDIFLRMNLESLGNQLVKSANILTSWSVLFLWLLRYSVHIIESFYGTEFYFNWIKAFLYDSRNRETICMVRKSAKNFHPEEIKIFLMIRKTDGTDWHLDVTTEPLLAPQNFLNIPLCNLCQNKWLPFLGLCFCHMQSFKYLYYMVILSETKTEERYYISLALTVVNCRLSFQNWKKLSQRKLRPRKKKWLAELGLKSNLETGIFWYRESHCQSRMKIGLVIFCFLKNKK